MKGSLPPFLIEAFLKLFKAVFYCNLPNVLIMKRSSTGDRQLNDDQSGHSQPGDSQHRSGHSLGKRLLLWTLFVAGLSMIAAPEVQVLYGTWSQHQLRASFNAEWHAASNSANEPDADESHPASSTKATVSDNASQGTGPQGEKTPAKLTRIAGLQPTARRRVSGQRVVGQRVVKRKKTRARWRPTKLMIPRIQLDAVVVKGISGAALRRGPGHDPATTLPGQPGNCVIAAHRNAYGWWFRRLDDVGRGTLIHLQTPQALYTYKVAFSRTVSESNVSLLNPPASHDAAPRLTLYSCTLPKSDYRLVVVANLVKSQQNSRGNAKHS